MLDQTLLVATRADARPAIDVAPAQDQDRRSNLRDIDEPHGDENNPILAKARLALAQADNSLAADYDPIGEGRLRIEREVDGMLRYGRRLVPDNLEILKLRFARSSATISARPARRSKALHRVIELVGADQAGNEVTGHLGEIYLRLGQLDDAIHYLRLAQGPIIAGEPRTAHILVHLSNALAQRGQMSDAIDVLLGALPASPPFYSNEFQVVSFALAVQYDRDDQRGAAFERPATPQDRRSRASSGR